VDLDVGVVEFAPERFRRPPEVLRPPSPRIFEGLRGLELELGWEVEERDRAAGVATVEGLNGTPNQLHVSSDIGILPQPNGFERRARVVDERLQAGQLSALNFEEHSHGCIERDPAPSTAQANSR
jgi:hypothetical protein